jgi:DNA-directed RNA polymerase II subunit RPB2
MNNLNAEGLRALRAQIRSVGFARDQIDAFNSFVRHVEAVVVESPSVVVVRNFKEHKITIRRLRIERPTVQESNGVRRQVMPDECLRRKLSYKLWLFAEFEYTVTDTNTNKVLNSIVLPDTAWETLPCMKFSDYCNTRSPLMDPETLIEDLSEPGGYFIILGQEKVMPMQEQSRVNYPMVINNELEYRAFNTSRHRSTSTIKINLKPAYDTDADTLARRTVSVELSAHMPFVSASFDPVELFRLVGVTTFDGVVNHVLAHGDPVWFVDRVRDALTASADVYDTPVEAIQRKMAHDRISNTDSRREPPDPAAVTASLMCTEFYPNQGNDMATAERDSARKAVLFGLSIRKLLLTFYGLVVPDDRDNYAHRRMALTSNVMTLVFRRLYRNWRSGFEKRVAKTLDQCDALKTMHIEDLIHGGSIGKDLEKMIKNGAVPDGRGGKSGGNGPNTGGDSSITHMVSRIEPHAIASQITRSTNPIGSKAVKPRRQHFSSLGLFDPNETPDGDTCGLVKYRCLAAGVRQGYLPTPVIDIVLSLGMTVPHVVPVGLLIDSLWYVFVSGSIVGVCTDPDGLLDVLVSLRRCGDLAPDISLYRDEAGFVHVNADAGSMWWPLLRTDCLERFSELVATCDISQLWQQLLCEGVVELINKDEEQARVRVAIDLLEYLSNPSAFDKKTLHEVCICSIAGARMVLSEFNMAPRKTYGLNMNRQAQGTALSSAPHRFDTTSYQLWNAERPLVHASLVDGELRVGGHTNLQTITISLNVWGAQGAEDSFLVNKCSLERGLFRHTTTRSTRVTFATTDSKCEQAMLPPEVCHGKLNANYDKVDPELAVVRPGTRISHNDVLVSRMSKKTTRGAERKAVQLEQRIAGLSGGSTSVIQDKSSLFRHREEAIVDAVLMSTTLEGEPTMNVRTRSMKVPETADKIACLTPNHRVQTSEGLVPIADVTVAHKVLCYNTLTDSLEYHCPTEVMQYTVDSSMDLFQFRGMQGMIQTVTPTHKMCVLHSATNTVLLRDAEAVVYEHNATYHIVAAKNGLLSSRGIQFEKGHLEKWANTQANVTAAFHVLGFAFLHQTENNADPRTVTHDKARTPLIDRDLDTLGWPTTLHYSFTTPKNFKTVLKRAIASGELNTLPVELARAFLDGALGTYVSSVPLWDRLDPITWVKSKGETKLEQLMSVAAIAGYNARMCRDVFVVGHGGQPNGEYRNILHVRTHKLDRSSAVWGVKIFNIDTTVHCITVPTGAFVIERDGNMCMTGNSSRSGQKGVFGGVIAPENLPFIMKTGMVPDIMMNPHSIASRMTNGQTLEMLLGFVSTLTGERIDGTPFVFEGRLDGNPDPDAVYKYTSAILKAHGFKEAKWLMADGMTGRKMECPVFVGVCGGQSLKHLVSEKWHARSRGPMVAGLNQPTAGRKEEGGPKDGEMERDAKLVHGAVGFLRERLMTSSDKVQVPLCVECGNMAVGPKHDSARAVGIVRNSVFANQSFCHYCQKHNTVVMVDMPCGFRTILGHQHALHVNMTYKFDDTFKQSFLTQAAN